MAFLSRSCYALQAQKLGCTVQKPAEKPVTGTSRLAVTVNADYLPIMKPQGEHPSHLLRADYR